MYLLCYMCEFLALMVALRSGIRLGWLIFFMAYPYEVMLGILVNTCPLGVITVNIVLKLA